jgi:hypothetical protein
MDIVPNELDIEMVEAMFSLKVAVCLFFKCNETKLGGTFSLPYSLTK